MVRAKFTCTSHEDGNIQLRPVGSDNPENKAFFKATPAGRVELNVVNPAAADQFEVGKSYYLDFTPAED